MNNQNFNTQDQLDYLTSQSRVTGVANVIAIALTSYVISLGQDNENIISWAWVGVILILLRILCYQYIVPRLRTWGDQGILYSKFLLVALLFLSGLVWAAAPLLFLGDPVDEAFTFIPIVIAGLTAACIPALAIYMPVYTVFSAPPLLACAIAYFIRDNYSLALLSIAYLIIVFTLAKNLGVAIVKSISIDKENAKLLEQVTIEKEKSEEAGRARSRFFAAANHDLRQPMQAIGLLLASLEYRLSKSEYGDAEKIVYKMNQSHDSLTGLFNSLLEVSSLDGGAIEAKSLNLSLDRFLSPLATEFEVSADAKGLSLTKDWEDIAIYADPILLGRILRNLLSNAIKFTRQGEVRISTVLKGSNVLISISDTGLGIPENELKRIFEEYHQINNPSRNSQRGIGLGLAVVEKMAGILGFSVSVQSELGKGSVFTLAVPLGEKSQLIKSFEAPVLAPFKGAKLLLVDDEVSILNAMQALLIDWQCEVTAVDGIEAALKSIRMGFLPDLVISDYRLKDGVTGLELISAVRQSIKISVPAIVVTGDMAQSIKDNVSELGCVLMHKPIKPIVLKNAIQSLLQFK